MDSKTGLVIQLTGILLIAVLSFFLRRSFKTKATDNWLVAWSSLSVALFSLNLAFSYEQSAKPFFALYFFGEYVFGITLIAGCRIIAGKTRPLNKLLFAPFALLAALLAWQAKNFDHVFNIHAFVFASFFAAAFFNLNSPSAKTFGWRVTRVALALLTLDFLRYFALYTLVKTNPQIAIPENYLAVNPIVDLVLEILLGFGMIIILLEEVLRELVESNEKLKEAHEKLQQMAQTDPLTTAFNRHAFYGFLNKSGKSQDGNVSGCVGFFDIDDLKPINDRFGHAVGDSAIRAVVGAIRSLIRAEDLIYRWGGDEFFVVMVSMDADSARRRMSRLEEMLTDIYIEGADELLTVRVSFGFTTFNDLSELEKAVKAADEEMYRIRRMTKIRQKIPTFV
jgi:diguanylate cyclase (GGDEF) domain